MSVKISLNTLKKMNEKMYPKLSADERFAMVIKTFVNGDEVQREKLVKSCPIFNYYESDHSYTVRMEASRDIVTVFIIQLLEYDKVISIMKILKGLNYKLQGFNLMKILNQVQAFLLAFETFCEEHVGIASREMIQAWYGYDERYIKVMEEIKHFIDIYQIKPDTQLKGIWLEKVFLNAWIARVKV
ncbi:hypothetical protein COJ85_11630 [Bacillus sp. AFS076308]|uniref:hypothetical protein n=1 Tax=Bacillus sp. AFS076308 TaxID=2033512 RepID=UPI000BF8A5CD|nr:hypothetical protein [Bacillus sp. AFS076308]PFO04675.1 hypothetical protein COJ85_11630 [Bacillus sp. AFS076308]